MVRLKSLVGLILAALVLVVPYTIKAADATQAEVDQLKRDIEDLRKRLNSSTAAPRTSSVERALDSKYGPNATVTTKNGKLTISGLVQAWYYTIQKDNRGLFDKSGGTAGPDTNEGQDNSSFRIRRTELKFTMDIHENVTAVVMIDPAREATSFPNITDNQAGPTTIFKRANNVSPEWDAVNGPGAGSTANIAGVQSGSGAVPRLLQDAYINYHGVIPHHDFQIGQFKPWIGEEGIRSSAQLDFVERSFVGQLGDFSRDLGASVHGTWWDDRFQYWVGAFDGAGNYLESAGQQQNRADDNDQKDINWRFLVRPLWSQNEECGCHTDWGRLELGASGRMGQHGESGGPDPIASPVNGLNRRRAWAIEHDVWFYYAPGGVVRGLWVRAEGAWIKDRNAPGQVADLNGAGGTDFGNQGTGSGVAQSNGVPTHVWGGYAAIGYKISESRWGEDCGGWLKNFEFAARYDTFYNVEIADPANPAHTNNYRTNVVTGGINYYIKGHDAKIQLNYNSMKNPEGGSSNFHNVRNNSFVVNFQVAF